MAEHRCAPERGASVSNAETGYRAVQVYRCWCSLVWVDEGEGFRIRVRPLLLGEVEAAGV